MKLGCEICGCDVAVSCVVVEWDLRCEHNMLPCNRVLTSDTCMVAVRNVSRELKECVVLSERLVCCVMRKH